MNNRKLEAEVDRLNARIGALKLLETNHFAKPVSESSSYASSRIAELTANAHDESSFTPQVLPRPLSAAVSGLSGLSAVQRCHPTYKRRDGYG